MARNPFTVTGPARVTATRINQTKGSSAIIVRFNGQQRTIPWPLESSTPYITAVHRAFGQQRLTLHVIADRPGFRRFEINAR